VTTTRKAFHEELGELRSDVIRFGATVLESIQAATEALLDLDLVAADRIINDQAITRSMTEKIDERCYMLLARQQPMAVDLRTIVAVLRVNHELELTANLMASVSKAIRRLYPNRLEPRVRGLIDRMREQTSEQLRLALDAYTKSDPALAAALFDMDENMSDLQRDLFRQILSNGHDDEGAIQRAVQVALVGRYFERAADHAVIIAQRVTFIVTGELPATARVESLPG
jgi:phosphate transport system protein